MDDANANVRDGSTRNGASCFGVMTGCFALAFLLSSALTLVALAKRWVAPSRTLSTTFSHAEEPSPARISDPSPKEERPGRVNLPERSKGLPGRVREGPGKQHPHLVDLPDGTPIVILDEIFITEKGNGAGKWYKVRGKWAKGAGVGWIHSDIVREE
jgi:hypothetical protein